MIRIVKSMLTIVAVAAIATGATGAYFSDTATITDNTFSTGVLEIRVDGAETKVGATFAPTAPGVEYTSPMYTIMNYGPPYFGGPSTLDAKYLMATIRNLSYDSDDLKRKVRISLEVSGTSGASWHEVYNNTLHMAVHHPNQDLLAPTGWGNFPHGWSLQFRYKVWLPDDGTDQSALMGKTASWDIAIEGRTG